MDFLYYGYHGVNYHGSWLYKIGLTLKSSKDKPQPLPTQQYTQKNLMRQPERLDILNMIRPWNIKFPFVCSCSFLVALSLAEEERAPPSGTQTDPAGPAQPQPLPSQGPTQQSAQSNQEWTE